MLTTRTRTLAHAWHLPAPITARSAHDIAAATARAGAVLVAHPATIEGMCRAVSPFGPLARSTMHATRVLGCPVEADASYPDGFVTAMT